jgi:hypothetical protein
MPKEQVSAFWSHLNQCDNCRLEFHRLQYALGSPAELPSVDSMLSRMRAAIEQWENKTVESGTGEQVKRRVATEIAPFLGPEATETILGTVTENADNLLSNIEPVLGLFLGARAASRLVGHVVDAALIRA